MENSRIVQSGQKFLAWTTLFLLLFNSSFTFAIVGEGESLPAITEEVTQNTEPTTETPADIDIVSETPEEIVPEILENTEPTTEPTTETPTDVSPEVVKDTETPKVDEETVENQEGTSVISEETNLTPEFAELLVEL